MKPLFIQYPKCGTCQKAAKWLRANGIEFDSRDITSQNPTAAELEQWIAASEKPIAKFFNASGLKYKELKLKDVVKSATHEELIAILASDGMLVKRPLMIFENQTLVGFDELVWSELFKKY